MGNQIKIIFIDLDGTLLNNESKITKYSKEVISKAVQNGIYIVLCSGRATNDVVQKSKSINASPIVISDNGSMVYNYKTNTNIYQSKIKLIELVEIWDFAKNNNINITFNSKLNRLKSKNSNKEGLVIYSSEEIEDNITQVVVDTNSCDSIKKLKTLIQSKYSDLEIKNLWTQPVKNTERQYYEMDITNKFNNKGKAAKEVLKALNIKKENAACFGDQMNDYSMFESCSIRVAMNNANDNLKQKANFITEYSNNEDGVAKFIDKYILLK